MCYVSVVIPVYNSEPSLADLASQINDFFLDLGYQYEIIFVNDGSADNSLAVCKRIAEQNQNVKVINLSRNFGQHNAIMAGLQHVRGELIVLMDDDLQNPPKEIKKLLEESDKGYDVVYGQYQQKNHHWFRNLGSQFNDIVATMLIQKPRNLYFCSFKIIRRYIVDEVIKYGSAYPYIDGLIFRTTRNIGRVYVNHVERQFGQSNYNLHKLIRLWLNMFTNFSILPLRLVTFLGLSMSLIAFLFGIFVFVQKFWLDAMPPGWASLMLGIMLLGGVQLGCMGLLGEYLGRMYLCSNQTPQYVIKEIYSPHEGAK